MEYLGEHIHHNQQHNLPTEGIVLSLYWDQEAMPEQSPQRPQRGMNSWSPGPGSPTLARLRERSTFARSEPPSSAGSPQPFARNAAPPQRYFGEPPRPNEQGGPPPQHGGIPPLQHGGPPPPNPPGGQQQQPPNLQPHPPIGGPPGQAAPPTHPTIAATSFRPPVTRLHLFVERERQAWRVHSDNAYMVPSPTTADFHEWDHNLLARMCRTFWDEYRTAINCLLYPMDTEWNALQRKRQSADEFQTLQQHITWNQGFNSNLLQMIIAVFPSYNEWIRRTVLSAGCAFRFMGLDQESPRYTVLSNDILQEVYNAIITSTSQGDLIDPAPSRFTLLHNQRDRTAHHMCAVTEVMLDFYNGSTDTVLDNDTSFLWSGWDQESVLRYMSAYIADMEYTFRSVLQQHTLGPESCVQLQLIVGNIHKLCTDIASAHKWISPAHPTFTFQSYTLQDTGYTKDNPVIQHRIIPHPIDSNMKYTARELYLGNSGVHEFGEIWLDSAREVFIDSTEATTGLGPLTDSQWRLSVQKPQPQGLSLYGSAPGFTPHPYPGYGTQTQATAPFTPAPSAIILATTDGSLWFVRQKGMAKAPCDIPKGKSPFGLKTDLPDIIEHLKAVLKTWFGGVDITGLLRNHPHLNTKRRVFENVISGTFDSEGHNSPEYRAIVGRMWADVFLKETHTPFYAAATELLAQLGHLSMESFRTDTKHWWEFNLAIEEHLAMISLWIGKRHLANSGFIGITSALCNLELGHSAEDLPMQYLQQLVSIWQLDQKNTQESILELRKEFHEILQFRNNILSDETCEKIALLQGTWARAPKELKAHVPDLIITSTERAIRVAMAIDVDCGHYNKLLITQFQTKLMPILSQGGWTGPNAFTLQQFCEDVREMNRLGRVFDLRMNTDEEDQPDKVRILATNLLDNNAKPPARKSTPGPGTTTSNTEARTCRFCEKPVAWSATTTWADHDCPVPKQNRGRASSPSGCRRCNKPRHECTCENSRSRSRDRSDSRGRSHGRDDLQDTTDKAETPWVHHPPKDQPTGRRNNDRGGGNRRIIGHGRVPSMCTLLASLIIATSIPSALAINEDFASHDAVFENCFVSVWSLIMTSMAMLTIQKLARIGCQFAAIFLPAWAFHAHQATSTTADNTINASILLLIAMAASAFTLSPFFLPRRNKMTALYRLMRLLTTISIMTAMGLAILGTVWVSYNGPSSRLPLLDTLSTPPLSPEKSGEPTAEEQDSRARPQHHDVWAHPVDTSNLTERLLRACWINGGLGHLITAIGTLSTFIGLQMFTHHQCLRIHHATHMIPSRMPRIPRRAYIMALLFTLTLLGNSTATAATTHGAGPEPACTASTEPAPSVATPTPGSPEAPHAYKHHVPGTSTEPSRPDAHSKGDSSEQPPPFSAPTNGTLIERYDKLLACTASLPDNLLRSIYLIDTGTQITLVCSMQDLTNVVELSSPLAWGGATEGAAQFASHKGDLTVHLRTADGGTHPTIIPGAYYSATARLNAVSTSDLLAAEVSLQLNTEHPSEALIVFNGSDNARHTAKVRWIESLPFLPTANLQPRTGLDAPPEVPSIFSCMLGKLPPADYMHLIFDHCPKEVLQRILARTVGLAPKTLKFCNMSGKCHTCMETRGRVPDSNDSDLPEIVVAIDLCTPCG